MKNKRSKVNTSKNKASKDKPSIEQALSVPDQSSMSTQDQLELWFQTGLGRALLASQREVVEYSIARFFGFHQAEIGVSHRVPIGNSSNLGHKFFVLNKWQERAPENAVISSHEDIALDHDVADLVILHHTLDFASDPHKALREASRILKPSGHLVVVGFNPLSSWGLRRLLSRNKSGPWGCRFVSGNRLEDWLSLLDFKVARKRSYFYALPFNQQSLMNRFKALDSILNSQVPLGAYYVMVAQKQVGLPIRTKRTWRKKTNVVGMPVANRVDPK